MAPTMPLNAQRRRPATPETTLDRIAPPSKERRQAELVALVALLDLHRVDPRPSQHHVFAAAPLRVGLAALVQLAQPGDEAVLVPLDDPPGHLLHDIAGDRRERSEPRHLRRRDTVAVEHLQRSHRHAMGFLEAIRAPQRAYLGELFDDVLLGLARARRSVRGSLLSPRANLPARPAMRRSGRAADRRSDGRSRSP